MNPKRILLADDDRFILELYKTALEGHHFQIETAMDGEKALQAATSADYDLVIMDIVMPKMNGIDSIQAIRKKRPHVPIIVITSFQDQFTEPLARLNVQEVLIKPVMITQLVRSVRKVIESGPSGPA